MMDGREKRTTDNSARSTARSNAPQVRLQRSKDETAANDRTNERRESTDKSNLCKQLDFLSSDFNPELVLRMPEDQVELPVACAKIFNNLDEYALKSFPSKKPSTAAAGAKQTDLDILRRQHEIKERMKEQIEVLSSKKARNEARETKTVLNLMESDESGLGKLLNKRLRIFVRRRRKSKHPCERYACLFGQLMFFDKHWNLILSDVSETMQFVNQSDCEGEHKEVSAGAEASSTDCNLSRTEAANEAVRCDGERIAPVVDEDGSNSKNKNETTGLSTSLISSLDNRRLLIGRNETETSVRISIRERHFTRLFIRGDNIIYISKV